MVPRRMLANKRKPEKNCIMKSFVVAHQIVFRMIRSSRIM
jgi:hypothetical protein